MSYPQILHHSAIAGVTGSCIQLRIDAEHCLLVDCGLFQAAEVSPENGAGSVNRAIDFPLTGIKALVAIHVYIDHVGLIPCQLAVDFKGSILCSEPSAKLLPIVLEDTFKLGFDRDQQQVWRYLELLVLRIISSSYDTWFALADAAQPDIVIAAGRMCAGGRNVDYLKAMLQIRGMMCSWPKARRAVPFSHKPEWWLCAAR